MCFVNHKNLFNVISITITTAEKYYYYHDSWPTVMTGWSAVCYMKIHMAYYILQCLQSLSTHAKLSSYVRLLIGWLKHYLLLYDDINFFSHSLFLCNPSISTLGDQAYTHVFIEHLKYDLVIICVMNNHTTQTWKYLYS